MPLSARHERFCRELMVDNNGTQAAIRAGYSAKTAESQASRLLSNAKVSGRVAELRAERSDRLEIEADDVVRELVRIAFSNMLDYIETLPDGEVRLRMENLTRDKAAGLVDLQLETYVDGRGDGARHVKRLKIKLADKVAPLNALLKHLGADRPASALGTPQAPIHVQSHLDLRGESKESLRDALRRLEGN